MHILPVAIKIALVAHTDKTPTPVTRVGAEVVEGGVHIVLFEKASVVGTYFVTRKEITEHTSKWRI